jgi:hypothetical protein
VEAAWSRRFSDKDVIRLVTIGAEGVKFSMVEELMFSGKNRVFLCCGALRMLTLPDGGGRVWWRAI